ncbi:MAG TPA: site-2 protease family protein [Gemmatimonadota bacterium]|nr:site-2 protease family protein [Gemmatimonadota bacterium]
MSWKFWKRARLVPDVAVEPVPQGHPAEVVARVFLEDAQVFSAGRERILRGRLRYDSPGDRARFAAALEPLPVSHYFERVNGTTLATVTHPRPELVPREWPWNVALFLATVLTTLWAGAVMEGAPLDLLPRSPTRLLDGLPFSAALMGILTAHELGHYVAARRYGLHVTLPFFVPMPLSPIGTLGAVIKMRTPIYTRRMLLDVGAAGPIAGMVVAIPVAIYGILGSEVLPVEGVGGGIHLGEPLLFKALVALFAPAHPATHDLYLNSIAFAGWIGFLVTALNMLPLGQLDGGHVLYALVGRAQHRIAWLFFLGLLVMGWWWQGWYVWAVLILIVIRLRHPPVLDPQVTLDPGRRLAGWLAVVLLVGCFVPVPFALQ